MRTALLRIMMVLLIAVSFIPSPASCRPPADDACSEACAAMCRAAQESADSKIDSTGCNMQVSKNIGATLDLRVNVAASPVMITALSLQSPQLFTQISPERSPTTSLLFLKHRVLLI